MIPYKSWKHFLAMTLGIVVGVGFPMWLLVTYIPSDWRRESYLGVGVVVGLAIDSFILEPIRLWTHKS